MGEEQYAKALGGERSHRHHLVLVFLDIYLGSVGGSHWPRM